MVDYEEQGHVAVLTINRPEARNAVNGDVAQGIEAGLDKLEENDDLWLGVLAHEGSVFCAGADLKVINTDPAQMTTAKGGFAGIVTRERTKPIIAAVDGPAFAGGCEILLACDMIVASKQARFAVPEVKRSLIAAAGAVFRLPRVLPINIAQELLLTGDPIDAERAFQLGMVNRLVEDGEALAGALELAAQININAPLAVRKTRQLMFDLKDVEDDKKGMALSTDAMMSLAGTDDFSEGITAFIEKRDPEWKGK